MIRKLMPLLALAATPSALHAKWLEASSAHFVIYANDGPKEIQLFAEQLERFHSAMAMLFGNAKQPAPSPSNRVTIYVVKNDREVRKLAGDGSKFIYAFYHPRAGGSFAIVPAVDAGQGTLSFSMIALLHEYAHHFQLSTARSTWPRWFVEGSAEFFASAKFERDGTVMLGMPANHRGGELMYAKDVTATDLLDPDSYEKRRRPNSFDAYYGKSWLLYHYLTFNKPRAGQFEKYLALLQQGQRSVDAARTIFGDLDQLEKELDQYLKSPRMTVVRMNSTMLKPAPVILRDLSAGEAAIMPVRVRSRRGVDREQALALLPEARAVAARFPKDAAVLAALAEAEHDAGNDDEAIAAADASLAIDPSQVNAYVQKGYALFRKADHASDRTKAYREARTPFIALNRIENDHPLPLLYYYLAQRQMGPPTQTSVDALERAVELAPFDMGLRFTLVMQQIQDKRYDDAVRTLTPLAYNPHGGESTDRLRRLLDRLKSKEGLDPLAIEALMNGAGDADAAEQDEDE